MDIDSLTRDMTRQYKVGDLAEALRRADEILASEPDNLNALIVKGGILSLPTPEFCDCGAAVELLREASSRHPEDVRYLLALGDVEKNAGEYEAAESTYRKVLALDPDSFDARIGLAALERHPGTTVSLEEAEGLAETAARRWPEKWRGHVGLANILQRRGDKKRAREELEIAISLLGPDVDDAVRRALQNQLTALPRR